jgi:hypothetical protein
MGTLACVVIQNKQEGEQATAKAKCGGRLHCAMDDSAVHRSGRDDESLWWGGGEQATATATAKAKAKATATAKAKAKATATAWGLPIVRRL